MPTTTVYRFCVWKCVLLFLSFCAIQPCIPTTPTLHTPAALLPKKTSDSATHHTGFSLLDHTVEQAMPASQRQLNRPQSQPPFTTTVKQTSHNLHSQRQLNRPQSQSPDTTTVKQTSHNIHSQRQLNRPQSQSPHTTTVKQTTVTTPHTATVKQTTVTTPHTTTVKQTTVTTPHTTAVKQTTVTISPHNYS